MLQDRHLDKSVPIPLYFQLKKLISEEIDNGTYPPDSMIPTEKELSQLFDISRTTVRQAITELVQEERLYRIKSKGTFVCYPKIRQDFMTTLIPFNEDMIRAGKVPSTEVLALRVVRPPEDVAEQLGIAHDGKAIYLYRKRCADGVPVVRVETYLPYELCKFIMDHDFNHESLYQVLSMTEATYITNITRICEARAANTEDANVLDTKRGKPIQYFLSMGFNRQGRQIEYSVARYRGDQNSFKIHASL